MKRIFYNCSTLLLMTLLGMSISSAQVGCPPNSPLLAPSVTPNVCINAVPGGYDLSQEGTGSVGTYPAPGHVHGWTFYSAISPLGVPLNPINTTVVAPGEYYAQYTTSLGIPCLPLAVATINVLRKDAAPFTTMTVCADNTPLNVPLALAGGSYDLTQIPGIDKWYTDPAGLLLVVTPAIATPGTYYGSADGNNTSNGCESELAVLTVNPAPRPPFIVSPLPMCVDPVTGTFDITDIDFLTASVDPNYPSNQNIFNSRLVITTDAALTNVVLINPLPGGSSPVPAGTYYAYHTSFQCASQPLEFFILPREVAPVLSATSACVDVTSGDFDLCSVGSTNPPAGTDLTWYASLANVSAGNDIGTCTGINVISVTPGTYYATYQGADCESAPTAFIVNETPVALNAYNCGGVLGDNVAPAGNCLGAAPNFEETIRLFSCSDDVFTVTNVEGKIKMNAGYAIGLNGGIVANAVLTYYASYADAVAQTPAVALATTVAGFAANAAANNPQTEFLWVTQKDPNSGCESAPARLRLRMRARPDIVVTTPDPVCIGAAVDLFTLVADDRDVTETWNITNTDPRLGPAVQLSTSPANQPGPNRGEPDGSIVFTPSLVAAGTYTFWYEAINEGNTYNSGCNEVASVTITVLPKPVITGTATPNPVCSGEAIFISFLDGNGAPIPSTTVNDFDVTAIVDGGLTVVSGPTTGAGLAIGAISTDVYENYTSGPLNVTYTITPNGPLPQNCPGDPIIVVVVINPEPIMTAGLSETVCSYNAANLALTSTNALTGVTYQWTDDLNPFNATPANPVLDGLQSIDLGFLGVIPGLHDKYPAPFANYGRPTASDANITDAYSNVTTANASAVYTIVPVSADGCLGAPETVEIITQPAPIVRPFLGDTICSGGTTNIALSGLYPLSINVVAFKWDVPTYPAGVTGPANGSNGDGSFIFLPAPLTGQIFITESFTNTSGAPVVIELSLVALGDAATGGCESLPTPVRILINPEPVLQSNWTALLCSNNPTIDLNVVTPTETSGVGCATAVWEKDVAGTWVTVSGVQTVSNGDQFRYTCTTVDGCTSSLTETVNLEDAPVVTAQPNAPLCASNVNLNATIVDLDGDYTPTVTNSVGGAYAHTAEWKDIFGNVVSPANAVTVRNGDTYNYVVTGVNGCTETVSYTFIVNPLPNAILTGGGTICPPATSTNDVVVSFTTTGPWTFTYTIQGVAQPVVSTTMATYTFVGSGAVPGAYQLTSITDGNVCTTMAGYTSNSVTVAAPGEIAAICRNITEQIDGNGFGAITGGDIDENSGFGCNSAVTLTRLAYPAIFTCANLGANSVTLKVFDPATPAPHDTATCVSIVTVEDNLKPSIVCANNAAKDTDFDVCYWETPGIELDPLFTDDNCTVVSVEHNYAGGGTYTAASLQGAQFPQGVTMITWTVTDQSGNQEVCVMSVTVTDNQIPVITVCPPSRQIYTSTDGGYDCESDIPDMLAELMWTDNCPLSVTTSQDPVGGSNVAGAHLDNTIVTFTVGDLNNAVTCTATLTLIDDEDPQFTSCPADTLINCDVTARTAADLGEATATDNCSANITITDADVSDLTGCNATGTIIRTFTANDNNVDPLTGNSNTNNTCVQVITVQDTTPPVVTGFADPTEYCDFSEIPRFTYSGFLAAGGTVGDNCGFDTTTFVFMSQNIVGNCGAIVTEQYGISDNCGNQSLATVTFIVDDNVIPTWNNTPAIADATINCDESTLSSNTGVPTWTDNCFSTIAEADANSTFVNDPALCGYYTYSFDRTFTVTDICGNSIDYTQTINVKDDVAPVITCASTVPANTVDTDLDQCYASIASGTLTASATDNCATANLTYAYVVVDNNDPLNTWSGLGSDAAGIYPKGSWTITFTATDPCMNASNCSLTLDVEDNQVPFVACVGTLDVFLDDNGVASIINGDIVSASSDNCPDHVVLLDKYNFDCSEVTAVTGNTITVTATVTDASGNTAACATVVTVIDNLPPSPDCQDMTVYLDGLCSATIQPADVAGNASDNCAIVSTTINKNSFDCLDLTILSGNNPFAPVEVTVTYTDPSGNTADCIARVTVKDIIPPSITCIAPPAVNNTPGLCEAPVLVPVPSTGDNCLIKTLTNDYTGLPSASATYPVGTTQVTWTIFDKAGNHTDCVVDVVVIDNEDPNALCKDITVQLDATGNASITAADLDNNSNDNCPGFVLTLNDYDFDCSDIQSPFNSNNTVSVTLTITDGAGLTDAATCIVTVEDRVAPTAICMDAVAMLDANGDASITTADIDNGSSDACGLFDIQVNPKTFDCSNVGNNTVTLQIMDNNGNIASCNANVDVQDNINPNAICQDTTVQLDINGDGVLTTAMVNDGSNDNCGIQSMTVSPNVFDCSQRNQTIVTTLTVTDNNGNVSTCTSNVLVKDEVSPTAQCRDLTIQLDANGDASITVADVDNGTVDNCTVPPAMTLDQYTFDCSNVGTVAVTLTAVDADGNDATCIATITVEDNVAPDAQCMDAVVMLDANGAGSIVVADIDNGSSDACGIDTRVLSNMAYTCTDLGNNSVTLTVTDVNGNSAACTANVDVQDNINPDVVYAGAVQFCNDAGVCEATVSIIATATDNCNVVAATRIWSVTGVTRYPNTTYPTGGVGDLDASGVYPVGEYTVTFTVFDESGNTDQEVVNFEVDDCEVPVITQAEGLCGGSVTLPNVAGDCYQQFAWTTPTAADNCNVASFVRTISDPSVQPLMIAGTTLGLFPVGTTTITYTAKDDEVNTTVCSFDVIVEDTEDPVILNCPTNIAVNNDPGNCDAQVVLPNNITAIDNCPIVTLSDDVPAGSVFIVGTTTVTFTAVDNSGRTATCVFDVVVTDTEVPVITCPANVAVSNDLGVCDAVVTYATPTFTDNCAALSTLAQTAGLGSGSQFPVGTTTETWTVTDASGNSAACSFDITVTDDEDPTISPAVSSVSLNNDAGQCGALFSYATLTVNDNCLGATLTQTTGLGSGSMFPVGTTTETYVATDAAGNTTTVSFDVTVTDNEDPTITCPPSATIGNDLGDCDATLIYTIPYSDNCAASAVLTMTSGVGNGGSVAVGSSSTESYTVTDGAGNTAACSFTITVEDQENPQISGCPANISGITNDPGVCGAVVTWNTNNLVTSDNCPGEVLVSNYQSGDVIPVGNNTISYVVTDAVGLTAECTFTIEVLDIEDPVITCPANVTVSQDVSLSPNCGARITGFVATATDNCSAAITNSYNANGADASDFYPIGTTTVTFTAADPAGNTDVCTADVTVTPVAPVASVNNGNPMSICSTSPSITASGNVAGQGFSGAWTSAPSTGVVFGAATSAISTVTFPAAGTYVITWTVTNDCSGASASASFTVNVYDPATLDFSCSSDPTLVGASDGVACVTPVGGSGSFSYVWSTGGTSSSVSGLAAGTYSVVVTDLVSGCTSSGSVTLVDPAVTRICEIEDYDTATGFGVWFRLAPGSIGGNGNNTWVGGNGTYKEYSSGEVQITGTIVDKVDNTKVWNVDIWLIGKQFWGAWGLTNGWAGTAANVGTNYTSWTYYTLNGSKSTLTGAGAYNGQSVTLTNRPYAANGGNGGFQVGQAANNNNVQYGMYGQFDYTGSYSGWGELSGRFNNCIGTQQIGPIAVLQGAYDGTSGMMRDDLRAASLVPTIEPYTGLGYTHVAGGGAETVAQSVLNTTGLDAIVDWVVVELRESANPANVIASRSALMQADGDIVDVDGISTVAFNAIADGDYYVAILHRNHVGIMTGSALTLISNAPTATTVDFTTTNLYGGPTAYATVGAGFQALVAGDASFDGQVQNTDDVYFWAPSTGSSGYQAGDYDLDAQVQNTDKVYYWISNAGLGTAIPQ